jgi:hypothetical protein
MPSDTLAAVTPAGADSRAADERVTIALRSVAGAIAAYRSSVVTTLERVRAMLAAAAATSRARDELGSFGAARIDVDRFAELSRGSVFDALARERLGRCLDVLREIADAPDTAFVVDVPTGKRPYATASAVLAGFGRAFGAAITADLIRLGAYDAQQHEALTVGWPFERWTKAERRLAPPIVLTVDGADFRVGELAELLDGTQRIVLVVRGKCAPAPLARLITPNTLVLQTSDTTGLDRLDTYPGPAVVACVGEDCAAFIHDPDRGAALWQRLTIWRRPTAEPRRTIGALSPRQQREELLQLDALAAQPALPSTPVDALVPRGDGNAAERLADWLLAQSGLTEGK